MNFTKNDPRSLFQHSFTHMSCTMSKESENFRMAFENRVDGAGIYCRLCYNGYHFASDMLLCCSICKFHYHQSCHNTITQNLIKNDFQQQCSKCGAKKCLNYGNMQHFSQKLPTYTLCNQANNIHFAKPDSNGTMARNRLNLLTDHFLNNMSYSLRNAKNIQHPSCHFRDTGSGTYFERIMPENPFFNDHLRNISYFNNPSVNQYDTIKCDIANTSNKTMSNTKPFTKQWLDNIDIDPVDIQDDRDDCIDVQDPDYDLKIEKQKNLHSRTSKKHEKNKKKNVIRESVSNKLSKLKKATNDTAISHVLKPLHNKRRLPKRHAYIRSSNSIRKYIKNMKESSDDLVLEKKTDILKKTQISESYNKETLRKRKRRQITNGCSLNDDTQLHEFSHLFEPAPRLPTETKDGQRLGRKYCRKYNTCDLKYVHVHRQTSVSKEQFFDTNGNQNKDESSFDILNLIPREVVPVITSNSQLGFREAIIDKRLMRYKRGVPIFRVGRKIPGELS